MPLYTRSPLTLYSSGASVSLTGTLAETALATISIPGGAMGPNGLLRVTTLWTFTNSANMKTLRVRFGGMTGVRYLDLDITAQSQAHVVTVIRNRNNQASQIGYLAATSGSFGVNNGVNTTSTVNTAVAQDLVIPAQLAVTTETITLEGYSAELLRG